MAADLGIIFKAYDVRGVYPDQFDEDAAYRIGGAFAEWIRTEGIGSDRIVLGLAELSAEPEPGKSIEEIMRPAPLTFRPGRAVADVCERLKAKNVPVALVTTSLGQFIGVLRRDELCQ